MNRIMKYDNERKKALVEKYVYLIKSAGIDLVPLTTKQLEERWGMDQRLIRRMAEDITHLYLAGDLDKVLVGTNQGYIYTDDVELIQKKLEQKERNWKSMCYNCYWLKKRMNNANNLTIDEYLNSIK